MEECEFRTGMKVCVNLAYKIREYQKTKILDHVDNAVPLIGLQGT